MPLKPFSVYPGPKQKRIAFAGTSYIEAAGSESVRPTTCACQGSKRVRVGMGPHGVQSVEFTWRASDTQASSWYEFLGDDMNECSQELVGLSSVRSPALHPVVSPITH